MVSVGLPLPVARCQSAGGQRTAALSSLVQTLMAWPSLHAVRMKGEPSIEGGLDRSLAKRRDVILSGLCKNELSVFAG